MTQHTLATLCISLLLCCAPAHARQEPPDMVRAHDAINYIGKFIMVCGVIASADYRKDVSGDPTFLNFDKPFPDHEFTAVIMGRDRGNFDVSPEELLDYKACVFGEVGTYRGKAQIQIRHPEQFNYKAPEAAPAKSADQ